MFDVSEIVALKTPLSIISLLFFLAWLRSVAKLRRGRLDYEQLKVEKERLEEEISVAQSTQDKKEVELRELLLKSTRLEALR